MPADQTTTGETLERVTDPVCGMRIDPQSAAGSVEYKGQRYYFCSVGCQSKFESDSPHYVAAGTARESRG